MGWASKRDQFAFASIDVGERSEAVMFQFKNVLGIIEWLDDAGETHWLDAGEHALFYSVRRKVGWVLAPPARFSLA